MFADIFDVLCAEEDAIEEEDEGEDEFVNALLEELSTLRKAVCSLPLARRDALSLMLLFLIFFRCCSSLSRK